MKIKYVPKTFNPYADIGFNPDTKISFIDENTIRIDGENSEVLYARA